MNVAANTPAGGEVLLLPIDQINPDGIERIGFFHPAVVAELSGIIARDGQLEPILVAEPSPRAEDRRFRLVCGRHRLEACRSLGLPVQARVVSGRPDELLRMQAAENIDRRDLTSLERAAFVGRRAEIVQERRLHEAGVASDQALGALRTNLSAAANKEKNQRTDLSADAEHVGKLSPSAKAMLAEEAEPKPLKPVGLKELELAVEADAVAVEEFYSWAAQVAAEFGLHERQLRRNLKVYRGLIKPFRAAAEAIAQCRIANNMDSLILLAGKPEPTRLKALRWLAEHPEAKTADEALAALGLSTSKGLREVDQQQGQSKLMTRAETALRGLSPAAWKNWAPALAKAVKPSALIAVRNALNERIEAEGII